MNTTDSNERKHRDDSNAAWGRCDQRDRNREPYIPRHLAPVQFGAAA